MSSKKNKKVYRPDTLANAKRKKKKKKISQHNNTMKACNRATSKEYQQK